MHAKMCAVQNGPVKFSTAARFPTSLLQSSGVSKTVGGLMCTVMLPSRTIAKQTTTPAATPAIITAITTAITTATTTATTPAMARM
jgi:hypothetical protein